MYDVIIVGACTAGTYFSGLLAKRGLKVLVIDRDSEENLAKRLDIVWILGRKAPAIFEKYLPDTDEITFVSKGRSVTLGLDLIDDIRIDKSRKL